jgi:phage shock protein A
MPLFRRIADILSANLNELVDRFEDPETMLRQAVREMETAVEQTMDAAAKSIASERLLVRQLDEHRRASERCFERARGAVGQGDDDAARAALAAKAGHDKLAVALEDQIAAARRHNARLRRQLDALRVRVAEARQTMHLLIARNRAARTQRQFAIDTECLHAGSNALHRFNHYCGRIERTEAEAHAWVELIGDDTFDPAAADADVELQLAALKQERSGTSEKESGVRSQD